MNRIRWALFRWLLNGAFAVAPRSEIRDGLIANLNGVDTINELND